jgi:hypothetical protein
MDKLSEKYTIEKDEVYGFDFAAYPRSQNVTHSHSLALIKNISENEKMKYIEKSIKISHAVKK